MKWPLNKKLLLLCKGRHQLSSRVWVRGSWTFLNKKMESVFSFFFAIEKEGSRKWGKERRRWVTVQGTGSWAAKCTVAFEEPWLPVFHFTFLASTQCELLSPQTFTEVCHSHTQMASVSGLQWKLKKIALSCLGDCSTAQGQGGNC